MTEQHEFLRPSSPLSWMGIPEDMAENFGSEGVHTVADLADAEIDTVRPSVAFASCVLVHIVCFCQGCMRRVNTLTRSP